MAIVAGQLASRLNSVRQHPGCRRSSETASGQLRQDINPGGPVLAPHWQEPFTDLAECCIRCNSARLELGGHGVPQDVGAEKAKPNGSRRHCCIKAKGALATHQSRRAHPPGTLENRKES
jgi:hypothetical protein